MNSSIGEEVKKIYGKQLSDKTKNALRRGSKLLTGIVIGLPIIALVAAALVCVSYFDKFVILQQEAFAQGSRIEYEYQRRADLIPKLITITLEYAEHEQAMFQYVSDARALKMAIQKLQNTSGAARGPEFDANLSKLMALAEQYPNLKATQSYQELMKKIETTEDRISTARGKYSAMINKYNRTVCQFPDNVFAGILRFGVLAPYHPQKDPMPLRNKRIFF
jgi:LemA protein